jgi:hypothetical protein
MLNSLTMTMSAPLRAMRPRARRWVLAAAAVLIFATPCTALAAEEGAGDPVVIELFTSQGCNSCPPADALINELSDREDLVVLSLHVDYWDYIGWEDPYGSPKHTERQRAYAAELDRRMIYTPQIMIDGRRDVMGARRGELEVAIAQARNRDKAVDLRIVADDGGRVIIPAGARPDRPATVWLVVFDDRAETKVLRGENAGRTLVNRHIVRELRQIGTWTGERLEIPLDLQASIDAGRDGCAVLLQPGGSGPIIGAAMMKISG